MAVQVLKVTLIRAEIAAMKTFFAGQEGSVRSSNAVRRVKLLAKGGIVFLGAVGLSWASVATLRRLLRPVTAHPLWVPVTLPLDLWPSQGLALLLAATA